VCREEVEEQLMSVSSIGRRFAAEKIGQLNEYLHTPTQVRGAPAQTFKTLEIDPLP
jgi:hypothetical protein